MKKKKSIVARLIWWAVIIALVAAFVIFIGKPLFTEEETIALDPPTIYSFDGSSKPIVMENDNLRFEMDPGTTQFVVTDKVSGTEWRSNPTDADKDPIALNTNKTALRSTLTVSYSTSSGNVELNNAQYSVDEGVYEIVQQDDGSVRINYTVGRVEKTYIMPTAITVERFNAFMDAMGSKTAKKVKSNYTLYEPEKLDSKSNKDEIIAKYPEVVNQPLYILKSDTSENNKKKLQDYFVNDGHYTQEDFEIDNALVAGSSTRVDAVYNVSVIYRLDGSDLLVEVPMDELRYYADYPIAYLTILPMFGAAGTADEGYMMVPEGGGAIINYNNGKLSQNSYFANVYGWDYASTRTEAISETRIDFPVFGMTKGEGSFICIIEEGDAWASVMADISGRFNSYNTVKARFAVLHNDKYNISAKTEQMVYMYEREIPEGTIRQRYRFVPSNNYVDMARAYGNYLEETYPQMAVGNASAEVPMVVELIGAIDKTVVKFGLPLESVVPVTTFDQGKSIMDDLLAHDAKNLTIRYTGWSNGGVTQKSLKNGVKVVGQIGGENGMSNFISAAEKANVSVFFDGVTTFAYDSGIFDGFFPFSDAARYTTREQIKLYPYYEITFKPAEFRDPYYLVRPQYAKEATTKLISKVASKKATGVAFRDIGFLLSGNYNPKDTTSREAVKAMNIASMQEAKDAGLKVSIKRGNAYALPYADLVTDMDLNGLPYSILDGSIPFYQIAIHGMVDYTPEAINLDGDYETAVLRAAEYGTGLAFTFMNENTKVLQDSEHTYFYGAGYFDWTEKAAGIYNKYQSDMSGLNNQRIVGHERLGADVTVTRYENGTAVYVNYGTDEYTDGGVTVPARSYMVKGGE